MAQYTHRQPTLPAPSAPVKKRHFPFKKIIILLIAAGLGSAYHSLTKNGGSLKSLTASGSLYEVFQKLRPNANKEPDLVEENAAPLLKASANGDEKTVKKLLASSQNSEGLVDARDSKRRTALMLAAYKGEKGICSLLIAAGANVSLQDKKEQNALDYAAANGLIETVKLLIEQGHKNDTHQTFEYASLMRASMAGDVSMLPKNSDKPSYINRLSVEGRSALHISASNGSVTVAKEILARGANVNLPNNSLQTPLHFAAWNNKLEMINLLLENGAKINAGDKTGNTPLMFAAARGNREAVDLFLSSGASKNIRNKAGDNAGSLASKKGFDDIADLLKIPKHRK